MELLINFITVFSEAAPWLCLGLIIAGLIKVYIPQDIMSKQLGGTGPGTIIRASLIGAPLPLCSCGVIPTAISLKQSGASRGATSSFLVSTPETGVDSISISYAMLGPIMAIVRPISAIFSAIYTGLLVQRFGEESTPLKEQPASCCSSKKTCCPSTEKKTNKVIEVFRYGFGQMIDDTAHWLLIGLGFAAAVSTFIPTDYLSQYGDSILTMLLLVLISIPMYICATASTPIAAGLLLAGVSPGAILVFMLAGPATNIALIGVVKTQLGTRSAIAYLFGVMSSAVGLGLLLDYVIEHSSITVIASAHIHAEILPTTVVWGTSVILGCAIAVALFKRLRSQLAS